jgi:hypothetical protein
MPDVLRHATAWIPGYRCGDRGRVVTVIRWDRKRRRWVIGVGRRRKSFRTLLDAENYLTREVAK